MSRMLRRSQRYSKPSSYQVGDVLKISRSCGMISNGRLVYQLMKGRSSSRNLWLVTFDDESDANDEEIYENNFGKLVHRAEGLGDEDEGNKVQITKQTTSVTQEKQSETKKIDQLDIIGVASGKKNLSQLDHLQRRKTKKQRENNEENVKTANFESIPKRQPPVIVSDSSINNALDREQRSLRRQVKSDETQQTKHIAAQHGQLGRKRRLARDHSNSGNKVKKSKSGREEVITVKLNTGVLYLYRGLNPRAEFKRKK